MTHTIELQITVWTRFVFTHTIDNSLVLIRVQTVSGLLHHSPPEPRCTIVVVGGQGWFGIVDDRWVVLRGTKVDTAPCCNVGTGTSERTCSRRWRRCRVMSMYTAGYKVPQAL